MPAYRNEETLRRSVESALSQTVGDLEVIVVDDASPVPCAEVLAVWRHLRKAALRIKGSPSAGERKN